MQIPLNAIKSFEAAARQLSFARAAKDLNVQPPAVSRQVAELERFLGVSLFIRSKPRLSLSQQGQELFASVSAGLNEIRQAIDRIKYQPGTGLLKVETSISFASCWLLPRLPDFHRRFPDIELQLLTRDYTTNYDPVGVDIAVIFGEPALPGIENRIIFEEAMIVVSAPKLVPGNKMLKVEQFKNYNLLYYNEPDYPYNWEKLFNSVDHTPPAPRRTQLLNSYIVYLQAILNGDGLGVGWTGVLGDLLKDGRLCKVSEISLETSSGYYCCLQTQAKGNADAQAFMDWVCGMK